MKDYFFENLQLILKKKSDDKKAWKITKLSKI